MRIWVTANSASHCWNSVFINTPHHIHNSRKNAWNGFFSTYGNAVIGMNYFENYLDTGWSELRWSQCVVFCIRTPFENFKFGRVWKVNSQYKHINTNTSLSNSWIKIFWSLNIHKWDVCLNILHLSVHHLWRHSVSNLLYTSEFF